MDRSTADRAATALAPVITAGWSSDTATFSLSSDGNDVACNVPGQGGSAPSFDTMSPLTGVF